MPTESIDYTPTIADLENKKAEIERTIALLRQLQAMTIGGLAQVGEGGSVSLAASSFMGSEVPTGAFLGKSIIEGTKLYLEIVKKKQTAKQIMDGLLKGGMESSRPKSFLKTVHSALTRARQTPNPPFVKVGTQWGLTGWFPKGIATGTPAKTNRKKAAKKSAKSAASNKKPETAKGQSSTAPPRPAAVPSNSSKGFSPNTKLVMNAIQAKPDLTIQDIAKETKMDVPTVNRLLSNLIRGHRVEKTPHGKIRAVLVTPANGQAVA
jgi:hypothetical protein